MPDDGQGDTPVMIEPLVGNILSAMMADTHHVTNTLIDSLTKQRDELQATLDIIRLDITSLLDQPYMPNPYHIERALYPSQQRIDYRLQKEG